MDYYTVENIQSSNQFFNRTSTISCSTGTMIDDKFKDYISYSAAVALDDIKVIKESEVIFNIFSSLEPNSLTSYMLVTVVDKDELCSLLIVIENGFYNIVMQFSYFISNIFDTDNYDFKLAIELVLEPFVNDLFTDDFIADIKGHGLMLLLKKNPICWHVFSELLKEQVRFEFFDY
jgi:hypothetical protein